MPPNRRAGRMPLLRLVARLPLPLWYALTGLAGFLAFRVARYRVAEARDNLARAFPDRSPAERSRLLAAYQRHLLEVGAEILRGLALPRAALVGRVEFTGLEALEATLADGRPVLLATAHCGNWEWLLLALSARLSVPVDALYKPLRSPLAERFFLALRGRFGARLIPAKDVLAGLARSPAGARVVAMVADQVPTSTPHRYWTRFLNQDTAFYLGLDDLSRATGYPVYVVFAERLRRGHYRAALMPLAGPGERYPLPPKTVVARYARMLEAHLVAHPADWLWGHRRWKLKKPLYGR